MFSEMQTHTSTWPGALDSQCRFIYVHCFILRLLKNNQQRAIKQMAQCDDFPVLMVVYVYKFILFVLLALKQTFHSKVSLG